MAEFGLVLIAVDDYPDPPGHLESTASARRLAELLGGEHGGVVTEIVTAHGEADVMRAVKRWASTEGRPAASVLYLVGHGKGDGLDHGFIVPESEDEAAQIRAKGTGATATIQTSRLAEFLQQEGRRRKREPQSWALVILDCCDSQLGVLNLSSTIDARYAKRPKNLAYWPAAPGGAAHSGDFVNAFERALSGFTENDERIPLEEIYRRIRVELGDLEPRGFLPDDAALTRHGRGATHAITLDVREELLRAIDSRPREVRNHFLRLAQGGEENELVWHFSGREREVARLIDWLRNGEGTFVVTGEAGSGKSALLGYVVVLADPELVDLYAESGLAPHLAQVARPPDRAFDVVFHLTGKTVGETVDALASALADDGEGPATSGELAARVQGFTDWLSARPTAPTVLVDGLDEAQDPLAIAALLRDLSERRLIRLVVGTRRSLEEGPDVPSDPQRRELVDALGAPDSHVLVVEQDADAVRTYAEQRLLRGGSPYLERPEDAAALAAAIAERAEPFLFARLATSELLARPAMHPVTPEVVSLLGAGIRVSSPRQSSESRRPIPMSA